MLRHSILAQARQPARTFTVLVALALTLVTTTETRAQEDFIRGDVNQDGRVSTSDAMMSQRFLFLGGPVSCTNTLDFDDNGWLNITDSVSNLHFVYQNAPPPAAPFPVAGPDPTENTPSDQGLTVADCESYSATELEQTEDTVSLGDVMGAPGDAVRVPIFVDSSEAVEAFQIVVSYDPSLFTPTAHAAGGGDRLPFDLDGTHYEGFDSNVNFGVVTVDEEAGIFVVGFIPDLLFAEQSLPPHSSEPVVFVDGHIPESAPPASVAVLEPVNLEGGYGPSALRNELTHQGGARLVSTEPRLEAALLEIVGDVVFFRGDANRDNTVDLADVQFTLGYLFLGTATPPCLDAADSNDDGQINVADPVATLGFLFLGAGDLPQPNSSRGFDPTLDNLDCAGSV